MLNFDDPVVGLQTQPPAGGYNTYLTGFTYHGLTFTTPSVLFLVDQGFTYFDGSSNAGFVSSNPDNIVTIAGSSVTSTLTISTGGNGALQVINLYVGQPATTIGVQTITISGNLGGILSPGCSRTVVQPRVGTGTEVEFTNCFADTLFITGITPDTNGQAFYVSLDSLLVCAITPTSALTTTAWWATSDAILSPYESLTFRDMRLCYR